jgi:hypothetical protein
MQRLVRVAVNSSHVAGYMRLAGKPQDVFTGDIYAHFLKKADQAAAEKLDNLMTRRKKQDGKANSGK